LKKIFLKLMIFVFCLTILLKYNIVFANIDNLNSTASILMDAHTGIILYESNANEKRYPASLTKLMTALLLIEHFYFDMDERITMSYNSIFSIPRNSSHIAMNENETLTAMEALYAIMLSSANEVSNAIAEHISGDIESFANLMTSRAKELGAKNTNFTNPHGLHDENHYTTAYDMAIIKRKLLEYYYFLEVINTRVFTIPPTERQVLERVLNNTHRMIHQGEFFHENVIGGKTGFTNEASHTLSTYARNNDIGLIAIVLGNSRLRSFEDTRILLDFGFSMYEYTEILNTNILDEKVDIVNFENLKIGEINIRPIEKLFAKLPKYFNIDDIDFVVTTENYLVPPISNNQIIGSITAFLGDIEIASTELVSYNYDFITHNFNENSYVTSYNLSNYEYEIRDILNFRYILRDIEIDFSYFNYFLKIFTLYNISVGILVTFFLIIIFGIIKKLNYKVKKAKLSKKRPEYKSRIYYERNFKKNSNISRLKTRYKYK